MKVHLQLFSGLQLNRFKEKTIFLEEKAAVSDLLCQLNIKEDEVGVLIINRQGGTFSSILKDGDHITMISPIYGG